jgi:hypothetical protein
VARSHSHGKQTRSDSAVSRWGYACSSR